MAVKLPYHAHLLLVHAEEHSEKLIEKAYKMAYKAANGTNLMADEKYEVVYNRLMMEMKSMDEMWKYHVQNQ